MDQFGDLVGVVYEHSHVLFKLFVSNIVNKSISPQVVAWVPLGTLEVS